MDRINLIHAPMSYVFLCPLELDREAWEFNGKRYDMVYFQGILFLKAVICLEDIFVSFRDKIKNNYTIKQDLQISPPYIIETIPKPSDFDEIWNKVKKDVLA